MMAGVAFGDATAGGDVATDAWTFNGRLKIERVHIRRVLSRIKSPPDGGLFGFRPDQVGMEDAGLAVMTLSFSRLARTGFS